jgi:hypothetical protein
MTEIEKYAVSLVGDGAESAAEDDIDEEGVFASEDDWRAASDLGVKMARAIKTDPESFLGWYLSTTGREVEI